MARNGRFALVVFVSLAIASTGVCSSLASSASTCQIAQPAETEAPAHDSCCATDPGDTPENTTCPASEERPTCRMCDDTVAFLLKGRTDGANNPEPRISSTLSLVPLPTRVVLEHASSLHLSQLSSSPPRYLLNVTFRN